MMSNLKITFKTFKTRGEGNLMWCKFFKKIKPNIGIDVGPDSIRVVELGGNRKSMELIQFYQFPIPGGCLADGVLHNKQELIKTMAQLVDNLGWQGRQVTTCIHGRKVMIKFIRFPSMPQEELKQAIIFEAEKYLPLTQQEMVLDFIILEPYDNFQDDQLQVLLAAVPKDVVMDYYEVFSAVSLKLVAVDIIPLVLQRIFLSIPKQEETFAVAHLTGEGTNLVVFINNQVDFSRYFAFMGIKNQAKISVLSSQEMALGWDDDQERKKLWQDWMVEVSRSLDFWYNQNPGKNLTRLYLTGWEAQGSGIEDFLSQKLGLRVTAFPPLPLSPLTSEYALACGLAMRGLTIDE